VLSSCGESVKLELEEGRNSAAEALSTLGVVEFEGATVAAADVFGEEGLVDITVCVDELSGVGGAGAGLIRRVESARRSGT
jgi:hypothetical protein